MLGKETYTLIFTSVTRDTVSKTSIIVTSWLDAEIVVMNAYKLFRLCRAARALCAQSCYFQHSWSYSRYVGEQLQGVFTADVWPNTKLG